MKFMRQRKKILFFDKFHCNLVENQERLLELALNIPRTEPGIFTRILSSGVSLFSFGITLFQNNFNKN